jgi:hypothetical protein
MPWHLSPAARYSLILTSRRQSTSALRVENELLDPFIPVHQPITDLPTVLSPPQLSRTTATAIRKCMDQSGGMRDAYFILNSARYSHFARDDTLKDSMSGIRSDVDHFGKLAIPFAQPVPLKLPYHALLHSLIREGLTKKASRLSELMMQEGLAVHSRSLETLARALLSQTNTGRIDENSRAALALYLSDFVKKKRNPMKIIPSKFYFEGHQFVFHLLKAARRNRHHENYRLWTMFIVSCLAQGEILAATLLFAAMLNKWQQKDKSVAEVPLTNSGNAKAQEVPSRSILELILAYINQALQHPNDEKSFQAALQSLANLASLLDRRLIPHTEISPLINSLSRCPKVSNKVWVIWPDGRVKEIAAYAYCHQVLVRLINPHAKNDVSSTHSAWKPNRHSQHSLLNYALVARLSPTLGSVVLRNLVDQPTTVTLNIVLRAAVLMRQPQVIQKLLHVMLDRDVSTGSTFAELVRKFTESLGTKPRLKGDRTTLVGTLLSRVSQLDADKSIVPFSDFFKDKYTVPALLKALASMGEPALAVDLLYYLIPELDTKELTDLGGATDSITRRSANERAVMRAVDLGPYVLTSFLDCLTRAGKTGLATRVWELAKNAENASQNSEKPWRLSVHAYTIMIQCFTQEGCKSHGYALGWDLEFMRRSSGPRLRSIAGREAAFDAYMLLSYKVKQICESAFQAMEGDTQQSTENAAPKPDARFFNAILSFLWKRPFPSYRVSHGRVRGHHLRRLLKRKQKLYAQSGFVSNADPMLLAVKDSMDKAGFRVPLAFAHLFVGRDSVESGQRHAPTAFEPRVGFPNSRRYKPAPWLLPTSKTKGLPFRLHKPTKKRRQTKLGKLNYM